MMQVVLNLVVESDFQLLVLVKSCLPSPKLEKSWNTSYAPSIYDSRESCCLKRDSFSSLYIAQCSLTGRINKVTAIYETLLSHDRMLCNITWGQSCFTPIRPPASFHTYNTPSGLRSQTGKRTSARICIWCDGTGYVEVFVVPCCDW